MNDEKAITLAWVSQMDSVSVSVMLKFSKIKPLAAKVVYLSRLLSAVVLTTCLFFLSLNPLMFVILLAHYTVIPFYQTLVMVDFNPSLFITESSIKSNEK
jgi:hypothetical protein